MQDYPGRALPPVSTVEDAKCVPGAGRKAAERQTFGGAVIGTDPHGACSKESPCCVKCTAGLASKAAVSDADEDDL